MDPKRFDAISQRLGLTGNRRRALGALGALGGLTVLGLPAAEVEAKRCLSRGKRCLKSTRENRHSTRLCKHCCSGASKGNENKKRCVCTPDGFAPRNGSESECCSLYINDADGTCQKTCAPTCEKCCPPPTGSTTPHCGTAAQTCCPTSLGGGACTTGNECCNTTADCPVAKACVAGCCLPIT